MGLSCLNDALRRSGAVFRKMENRVLRWQVERGGGRARELTSRVGFRI